MQIYLDIESIPSQRPDARELVRQSIKPPGTLKKPESIAAWWQNESAAAVETEYRRQSLDGGLCGEIISIACCTDTDREWVRCREQNESEAELLSMFFDRIETWTRDEANKLRLTHHDAAGAWPLDAHYLIAHNSQFDVGFLWRRSKVLGVPTPRWLPSPSARPGRDFGCSMLAWAGHGGRVSLDSLCRALGVPTPKTDMTGAAVFDNWLAGRYHDISKYNMNDALACRAVWERLQ